MVLKKINPDKRKVILDFFNDNFNIDLEKYDEEQITVVVVEIKKMLNERINEEKVKYNNLYSKLEMMWQNLN